MPFSHLIHYSTSDGVYTAIPFEDSMQGLRSLLEHAISAQYTTSAGAAAKLFTFSIDSEETSVDRIMRLDPFSRAAIDPYYVKIPNVSATGAVDRTITF